MVIDGTLLTAALRAGASIRSVEGRALAHVLAAVQKGELSLEEARGVLNSLLDACRKVEVDGLGQKLVQHVEAALGAKPQPLPPMPLPYAIGWDMEELRR